MKDNGSTDNYGSVVFALNGYAGYNQVSSSQVPVYDGEFYSVMLKRQLVPAIATTISGSSVDYLAENIQLSQSSNFPNTGEITVQSDSGEDIILKYASKNDNTNKLLGVTGWPKRQPKSFDLNKATSGLSSGVIVKPVIALNSDASNQDIKYELFVKKYNESTDKIYVESYTSTIITGSLNADESSHNSAFTGSETMYIGGESGNPFGSQFSGSMMEFRYWNSPLLESAFDNHVTAPKAYNGNHASASYADLVLRYSFDDNTNLNTTPTIRDTSANQSYVQAGTAVNFASEINYSSVEDTQRAFVPNVSPTRRMSSKVRIESNTITPDNNGNITLSPKLRKEESAYDLAPVDSNKVGIYFAPTDVINEDIILSVADLDFNKYIGDPRDRDKDMYKDLNHIASTYWQKYNNPNNFWDYVRLLKYYDNSLYDQIRKLIPGRSAPTVGLVIESNIFERSKVVINRDVNWDNEYYSGEINVTDSDNGVAQVSMSATFPYWEGVIGYDSEHSSSFGSDIFRRPTLYNLTGSSYWGNTYATASVEVGGPEFVFSEGLQPFVSQSRMSNHNFIREYFYTTEASQSVDNHYSSSLYRARYHTIEYSTSIRRLYYEGCLQTIDTTPNSENPVEVTITSPTELITKEPGESRLKVK